MNYVNSIGLRKLRESAGLSQRELADRIGISDKAVSKWETGRGLPDVGTLSALATALGVSLTELFSGNRSINQNPSGNMLRSCFYVCPDCGNIIHSTGSASLTCCGKELHPMVANEPDAGHEIQVDTPEDEYYVYIKHPMTREHHIHFISYVNYERVQLVRLYPEQEASARFQRCGSGYLYWFCNHDGLYKIKL